MNNHKIIIPNAGKITDETGVVKAFIVSGNSEFGSLWLSETDGGAPLVPNAEYIYIVQTNGNFKNKIFSWNGSLYEQLASGGIPEAPVDGKAYGRQDGEWTNLNMLIDNSIQQAIEDVLLGEV